MRVAGLVGALVLRCLAVIGDSSWAWWGGTPWWLLPFALSGLLLRGSGHAVAGRPRARGRTPRRRPTTRDAARRDRSTAGRRAPREAREPTLGRAARPDRLAGRDRPGRDRDLRRDRSEDVHWTTYLAVALARRRRRPADRHVLRQRRPAHRDRHRCWPSRWPSARCFPSGRIGAQQPTPTVAADVKSHYKHGIGPAGARPDRGVRPGRAARTHHQPRRRHRPDHGHRAGRAQRRRSTPTSRPARSALFGREDDGTDLS